jgi:hypothetical protein
MTGLGHVMLYVLKKMDFADKLQEKYQEMMEGYEEDVKKGHMTEQQYKTHCDCHMIMYKLIEGLNHVNLNKSVDLIEDFIVRDGEEVMVLAYESK